MATIADIDPESNGVVNTVADEPVVAHINSDEAVFESLASETARQIVSSLAESPATTSELAVDTDTSIQNAQYHLERLQSVGVVEAVGITYSSRGRKMDVYDLSGSPLVFVIGDADDDLDEVFADYDTESAVPDT